jgi:hypothetical protein
MASKTEHKKPRKSRKTYREDSEILERLQAVQAETTLSGRKFAAAIGLEPEGGTRLLRGVTGLTIPLAYAIELKFGIQAKWLLEGEEPMRADPRVKLPEWERRMLGFMQGTLSLATVGLWIFEMVRILAGYMRSGADYDEFTYNDESNIADEGERRRRSEQWHKLHRELVEKLQSGAVQVVGMRESLYSGLDYLLGVFEAHRDGGKLPDELEEIMRKFETLEGEGQ